LLRKNQTDKQLSWIYDLDKCIISFFFNARSELTETLVWKHTLVSEARGAEIPWQSVKLESSGSCSDFRNIYMCVRKKNNREEQSRFCTLLCDWRNSRLELNFNQSLCVDLASDKYVIRICWLIARNCSYIYHCLWLTSAIYLALLRYHGRRLTVTACCPLPPLLLIIYFILLQKPLIFDVKLEAYHWILMKLLNYIFYEKVL